MVSTPFLLHSAAAGATESGYEEPDRFMVGVYVQLKYPHIIWVFVVHNRLASSVRTYSEGVGNDWEV